MNCVYWYDDDSGYVTCGADGQVFSIRQKSIIEDQFHDKGTDFQSVIRVPELHNLYVVGGSKLIEVKDRKEVEKIDVGRALSQVVLSNTGKALFVSTAGEETPGAVLLFRFPFEKTMEVQAHSKRITRMKLSNNGQQLFTVGEDGHLVIYDVKDRDIEGKRGGYDLEQSRYEISDEILTGEQQIEELHSKKNTLINENQQLQEQDGGVKDMISLKKKDEELQKIREDSNANKVNDSTKYEALNSDKQNKTSLFDGQIKSQELKYAAKKEAQKNQYSKNMLEDSTKY